MLSETSELQDILQRLSRVERQNHTLKLSGFFVLAVLVLVLLTGQASISKPPAMIEAQEFVLRGANGPRRASLAVASDGSAAIHFYDNDGNRRAAFGVLPDGLPDLHLYAKDGATRVLLRVMPNGAAGLGVADPDGTTRASVTTMSTGQTMFALYGNDTNPQAVLGTFFTGTPMLHLYDMDRKHQAQLGIMPDGLPSLTLQSKEAAVGLGLLSDGSPFSLLTRNGKVIWKAP